MSLLNQSLKLAALLVLVITATGASAQRGELTTGTPRQFTNPNQGYPGFFDTNFADKGSLVVEWPPILLPIFPVPSIEVDYGVTDTLTVGTNAIVSTLPWLLGAKGISLKARTLIYGNETVQNVATIYGGSIAGKSLAASWQVFSSNNSWKLAPRHIITGQAVILHMALEAGSKESIHYTNLQVSTLTLGGGYQFLVTENGSISTYLMVPAITAFEADTVAANISANLDARNGEIMWGMARSSLDFRNDDWLYSLGGLYVYGLTKSISPWVSATTRW
jgi:hypothetical protein